jgi:hypothetical protein
MVSLNKMSIVDYEMVEHADNSWGFISYLASSPFSQMVTQPQKIIQLEVRRSEN